MEDDAVRRSDEWPAATRQQQCAGRAPAGPGRRWPVLTDRVTRQLEGIDAWNASRPVRAHTIRRAADASEQRQEALRRLVSLGRAHDALLDAVSDDLAREPVPVPARTAVIAHAHGWYARRLAQSLAGVGVTVLLTTNDGAQALGTVVAEQPDVLVCGERLRMMTGCLLLAEAALFAPHTVLVAQVDDGAEQMALGAGAAVTVLRHEPPTDVMATLIALIADRP